MDYVACCQKRGIALRGLDKTKRSEHSGKFLRAVKILRNHVPDFDQYLKDSKNAKKQWLALQIQKDMENAIVLVVLE